MVTHMLHLTCHADKVILMSSEARDARSVSSVDETEKRDRVISLMDLRDALDDSTTNAPSNVDSNQRSVRATSIGDVSIAEIGSFHQLMSSGRRFSNLFQSVHGDMSPAAFSSPGNSALATRGELERNEEKTKGSSSPSSPSSPKMLVTHASHPTSSNGSLELGASPRLPHSISSTSSLALHRIGSGTFVRHTDDGSMFLSNKPELDDEEKQPRHRVHHRTHSSVNFGKELLFVSNNATIVEVHSLFDTQNQGDLSSVGEGEEKDSRPATGAISDHDHADAVSYASSSVLDRPRLDDIVHEESEDNDGSEYSAAPAGPLTVQLPKMHRRGASDTESPRSKWVRQQQTAKETKQPEVGSVRVRGKSAARRPSTALPVFASIDEGAGKRVNNKKKKKRRAKSRRKGHRRDISSSLSTSVPWTHLAPSNKWQHAQWDEENAKLSPSLYSLNRAASRTSLHNNTRPEKVMVSRALKGRNKGERKSGKEKNESKKTSQKRSSSESPIHLSSDGSFPSGSPPEAHSRDVSDVSVALSSASSTLSKEQVDAIRQQSTLHDVEFRATGGIARGVYTSYIRAMGRVVVFLLVVLMLGVQLSQIATDLWLSHWSNEGEDPDFTTSDTYRYLMYYTALSVISLLFLCLENYTFSYGGVQAARELHKNMLKSVTKAPVAFFDVTPVGRIMNRFSQDMEVIDKLLPFTLHDFSYKLWKTVAILVLISVLTTYFGVVLLPIFFVFHLLQKYYRRTSQQLKRMDNTSKSPVFAFFSQAMDGLETIRAFNEGDRFEHIYLDKIDANAEAFWVLTITNRWLGIRLDIVAAFILVCAAGISIYLRDQLSAGTIGLVISSCFVLTSLVNRVVREAIDSEMQLSSVERVDEYNAVEPEGLPRERISAVSTDWPKRGNVVFNNVSAKYRPHLPLVLKGVDLDIEAGENIGVVGRTGAGKSSLTSLLFRVVELHGGKILIDNVDISKVPLHRLRSSLAIIPQDPVLFSGTLRTNLDPYGQFTDDELWAALKKVDLKKSIKNFPNRLETEVREGGNNFSIGERQLLCMARAVLQRAKVVVLDEATASVDLQTDEIVQTMLREEFRDSTVITIAHRIETILDSDRILVLDKGRVAEFDKPSVLLSNKESLFSILVAHSKSA